MASIGPALDVPEGRPNRRFIAVATLVAVAVILAVAALLIGIWLVRETVVRRWELGLPHPRPGRHLLQGALEQPLGAVHLAGDYLGTTYIETAIETGTAAAQRIRSMLETSEAPSPPSIG